MFTNELVRCQPGVIVAGNSGFREAKTFGELVKGELHLLRARPGEQIRTLRRMRDRIHAATAELDDKAFRRWVMQDAKRRPSKAAKEPAVSNANP